MRSFLTVNSNLLVKKIPELIIKQLKVYKYNIGGGKYTEQWHFF